MPKRKSSTPATASSEVTSAGVPWSEVPDFALFHVEWMDGRHGSAKQTLPPVDRVAIPPVLFTVPKAAPGPSTRNESHDRRQRCQMSPR